MLHRCWPLPPPPAADALHACPPCLPSAFPTGELEELLGQIDAEADLHAFTRGAAGSVESADALSARQREAVDQLCNELLGSAEIVRQGSMQLWSSSSGRWRAGHLVLTQAGWLHFFLPESAAAKAAAASGLATSSGGGASSNGAAGSSGGSSNGGGSGASAGVSRSSSAGHLLWGGAGSWAAPLESLNLSRCSFETGEAPVSGVGRVRRAWEPQE